MALAQALKEQYHAGLAMLAEGVQKCPDDLWTSPNPKVDDEDRVIFRAYWRIAFHTVYFCHLYMGKDEEAFRPWPARRAGYYDAMWQKPWDIEPYEFPEDAEPATKAELLAYIDYVDSIVDSTLDEVDFDSPESGFYWYSGVPKLTHELMNIRHLQGHVGQLSEHLLARGLDIDWVTARQRD